MEYDSFASGSIDGLENNDVDPMVDAAGKAQARVPHPSPDMPSEAFTRGVNSPTFFAALVKWHPGLGAFQYLADCRNPADMPPDGRFNAAIKQHPRYFAFCLIVDSAIMAMVLAGLVVLCVVVAVKALF